MEEKYITLVFADEASAQAGVGLVRQAFASRPEVEDVDAQQSHEMVSREQVKKGIGTACIAMKVISLGDHVAPDFGDFVHEVVAKAQIPGLEQFQILADDEPAEPAQASAGAPGATAIPVVATTPAARGAG